MREAVAEAVAVSRAALGGHCYLELAMPNPVVTRMIRSASSRSVYFSQNSMMELLVVALTLHLGAVIFIFCLKEFMKSL